MEAYLLLWTVTPRKRLRICVLALVVGLVPAAAGGAHAARLLVRWRPAAYAVGGAAAVRVATVEAGGGITAYATLIDQRRAQLALYPGLSEPPAATPRGTGEVPFGERWRLLATFNSGFKASAGAGGFLVNGVVDEPLRTGLGTVVEYRNGTADIVDWQGRLPTRKLVLARQNLPLIVSGGRPNPSLDDSASWGATLGGVAAVWRTALGIDRHGKLLYAAAPGQTAPSLAALMIGLGAVRAIELDINPEWPGFYVYGHRGGRDPTAVVPNPQEPVDRWLSPDSRDFFAVYTRVGGGPLVPFR